MRNQIYKVSVDAIKAKAFDDICEIINDSFKDKPKHKYIDFEHGDMIVDCVFKTGDILEAIYEVGKEI